MAGENSSAPRIFSLCVAGEFLCRRSRSAPRGWSTPLPAQTLCTATMRSPSDEAEKASFCWRREAALNRRGEKSERQGRDASLLLSAWLEFVFCRRTAARSPSNVDGRECFCRRCEAAPSVAGEFLCLRSRPAHRGGDCRRCEASPTVGLESSSLPAQPLCNATVRSPRMLLPTLRVFSAWLERGICRRGHSAPRR